MGILDENPNLEILQFPITKFFDIPPQTTGGSGPIEIISDTEPLLRGWLMERKISSYFCNKIFRHSVFDGLQFPRGYYEDRYLMSQVLRRVKSVGISGQGCYYYRQHPAQTTRQPNDAEMSRNLLGAEASIVKAIQGYKSLNRVKVDRYLNCLAHAKALGASLWEEEKELLKSIRPSIAEINLLRLKPQLALRCLIWNILSIDRYLKFF
ncbi:MAG: hypothetical protein LIP03_04635 [Bacteroidales bacterium]|nr:hypothetical protein [Bacteroidales bacterium]